MNEDVQREWLLELLERYGRNLHSFMVLEPGLSVWRGDDAAIAYVQRGGYWVTVGGPLCAAYRSAEVAHAFREDAAKNRCRVVFFGVTQPLVDRLSGSSFDSMQVGLAPGWHPSAWEQAIRQSRKLRNRLSKSVRDGIRTRLLSTHEVAEGSPLRTQFMELTNAWSASKALPPMGFMVTLELFQHAERRRYFVAECEGQVCGFAVCIPVYGRKGWLVEDMIVAPSAPSGCSEALIDAAMRHLVHESADYVSLGMVALAGLNNNSGPVDHYWLSGLLRVCSRTMGWLYNFEGLYRFRNKLQPTIWEPIYIVAGSKISFLTIRAILMAFAQGWVPRFGLRVVGHWIRHRLPTGQVITQLTKPSAKPVLDWRTAGLAIICVLAVAFAVVGMGLGWLPAWLAVALGTLGAYAGFTPIHEAVHGNVSRYRFVNLAVGHVCSLLLTGAFRPYVYLHSEHHLHTNDAVADPDVWCGNGPKWSLPLRWATQDMGYLRFYFQHWSERPWLERGDLLGCTILYCSVFVATALTSPTWFMAVCLGWFLPARLALSILAATFSWLPHEPHHETNAYRATTVRSARWLTWALLGQNFHLVHHLDPRIPFYRLSRAWKQKHAEMIMQGAIDKSTS